MATCSFHPDRETFRSCSRCGRPACHECLIDAPVGAQCVACVRAARPPASQQVKMKMAQPLIVTKGIIGVCVALQLLGMAQAGRADELSRRFALYGPAVRDGEWYRLLTAGFLHAGLLHLAFNCFAIWNLGQTLEGAIGKWRFGALFLVSVLGGSAGAILLSPRVYSLGASGGAFGLMGAAVVGMRVRGIALRNIGWFPPMVINLLFTFGIPGISIGGHLGGILAGGAVGAVIIGRGTSHEQRDISVMAAVAVASVGIALVAANRIVGG